MLRDLNVPAKTNCKAREYMSLCKLGKSTVLVRFEPQPTQVPLYNNKFMDCKFMAPDTSSTFL